MSEPCRSRRGEGYEARDDEKQEKAPALFCAGASTSARSAGSFQGWPLALFWAAEKANNAVLIQKGKEDRSLRLSPDAISKNGVFSIVKDKKDRHTVWLEPAAWDMVEGHYHGDNCSTKNEYIEKAIRSTSIRQARTSICPASSPTCWRVNWARWAAESGGCYSS